jgi:L-ascorbate metabolism protein UlaG (beta-lactamase superfamily)
MRVRKFGHACLLVEERGEALLFDPGRREFLDPSAGPDAFAGVSVIVVTHWHPDHADPDLIRRVVERSGARVLATRDGQRELRAAGVEATVPDQGTSSIGAFTLRTVVVPHAALLGSPAPDNLACLVNDRLLHSGDSFDAGLGEFRGVEALALPVTAPWMTELDAAAFAERLAPRRVLPVHDGYVKDFFRQRRYEAFRGYLEKKQIGFEGKVGAEGAVEL